MFDVGDRIIGLELPDTFYKLAELLEQDQFELLLSKNRHSRRKESSGCRAKKRGDET